MQARLGQSEVRGRDWKESWKECSPKNNSKKFGNLNFYTYISFVIEIHTKP